MDRILSGRVASFDNDGTMCCEKPLPIALGFILRRLAAMAQDQPELRIRQRPRHRVVTTDRSLAS